MTQNLLQIYSFKYISCLIHESFMIDPLYFH